MSTTLGPSIGALLIGSWVSVAAWGIMSYQACMFLRHSIHKASGTSGDRLKLMVSCLWCLDTLHIMFASHALYWYLISNAASESAVGKIIWSLPATIAVTAIITFGVQLYFAHRIYILSRGLRIVAILIWIIATARLVFGTFTTVKAIMLGSFAAFQPLVRFLVTTGLALSVAADLLVTSALCIFLTRRRTGFVTDDIIDKIIRWSIQTGAITSLFGFVSMICAIAMPHNLIWLGVHMIISKLYTTTTISNLNSREHARDERARQAANDHGLTLKHVPNESRSDRQTHRISQVAVHVQRDIFVEQCALEYSYPPSSPSEKKRDASFSDDHAPIAV